MRISDWSSDVCSFDLHADAPDPPVALPQALDLGAHGPHGGGGAQHILALQQAGHPGRADAQRAENQRPVRNRLVARHGDAAAEGLARAGMIRAGGLIGGGSHGRAGSLAAGGAAAGATNKGERKSAVGGKRGYVSVETGGGRKRQKKN